MCITEVCFEQKVVLHHGFGSGPAGISFSYEDKGVVCYASCILLQPSIINFRFDKFSISIASSSTEL